MTTGTKDWVQYGSALGMLVSGVVLTFISFFIYGDVTDNVLMYVGECLVFAGGIFGVSTYFKSKGRQWTDEIKNLIRGGKDENE